jgi:hypothetical protein
MRTWPALCLVVCLAAALGAAAQETPETDPHAASELPEAEAGASAEDIVYEHSVEPFRKRWYLLLGIANVHPRLDETEDRINVLINGALGSLFPRWERPETFADWRDDFKLWDFHLGIARDLSPKWTWFTTAGAIAGYIPNSKLYFPLGIPVVIHADFSRKTWFVSTGVDYYPNGKPLWVEKEGDNPFRISLSGARPYFEAAIGYVYMDALGQVKLDLPKVTTLFTYDDQRYHDLFYVSPRVGLDIPVGENSTVALQGGYLFFKDHSDEYNTWSWYMFYRHKL